MHFKFYGKLRFFNAINVFASENGKGLQKARKRQGTTEESEKSKKFFFFLRFLSVNCRNRDGFEPVIITTRAANSKGSTNQFTRGMVNTTCAHTAKKELYEAD